MIEEFSRNSISIFANLCWEANFSEAQKVDMKSHLMLVRIIFGLLLVSADVVAVTRDVSTCMTFLSNYVRTNNFYCNVLNLKILSYVT